MIDRSDQPKGRAAWNFAFAGILLLAALAGPAEAQVLPSAGPQRAADSTQTTPSGDPSQSAAQTPRDPGSYQLWTLVPALIAIVFAIITRQVIPSLIVAVLVGAYMLVPCLPSSDTYADSNSLIAGLRLAAERYTLGAIVDDSDGFGKLKVLIFTLLIGFCVGVMGRNGGTAGMVKLVAGDTDSPRRGTLTAWLAGLVVFFDDYANTMIVGPTMRSVFDRLRQSRAKLAYIVDSTAAPIASLAVVGTWVGAEIGFIQTGLDDVTAAGVPAFLVNDNGSALSGMQAFLGSLPYRFYPILALFLVFLVALTGRDFGPMKRAQGRALAGNDTGSTDSPSGPPMEDAPTPRWWLGLVPVLVLVGATVAILLLTGAAASAAGQSPGAEVRWWTRGYEMIGGGDTYLSIFYGALLAAVAAVLVTVIARACPLRDTFDAGLDAMARMFPALVILVLAWALSAVEEDLMLGQVVTAKLQAADFPVVWAPLAVFLCAAGISFATGTSWGTMGILCPVTVVIMARLAADMEPDKAVTLFYAAVGSVLAGAVFGDHCSPISDTTVLSSLASGCRHEEHVWTQIPYALVGAAVAMGVGDVMCSVYGRPWYYGLGAGAILLVLIVFIVGRRPVPSTMTASLDGPAPSLEERLYGK